MRSVFSGITVRKASQLSGVRAARAEQRTDAGATRLGTRATEDAAMRRLLGAQTAVPQLGSSSAMRNDEPQPHEATTFGFFTSKPAPMRLSV